MDFKGEVIMNIKMDGISFLSGLQLADSALPIGRFAYSHGLESFLAANPSIKDEAITEVISSLLLNSIGPIDGVSVALSHREEDERNVERLVELDHMVTVRKITPNSRQASQACGRQLASLTLSLFDGKLKTDYLSRVVRGESDGNIGIVMGSVAANLNLGCTEAVLIELRDSVASLFSAAIRLGKISALKAQIGLKSCESTIITACESALVSSAESMYSTAPQMEIHSMLHEHADVRMFRS